jgi:glycosyltransferase involved in cell wall biosynthesis
MNASDLMVLPFRNILSSSSVMLAMSFARPVVTPAMGCIPEYVPPSAGMLYDPGDPEGLYKALTHCVSLELTEMGQAAFEQAEKFTWENMANQTLSSYGIRV